MGCGPAPTIGDFDVLFFNYIKIYYICICMCMCVYMRQNINYGHSYVVYKKKQVNTFMKNNYVNRRKFCIFF